MNALADMSAWSVFVCCCHVQKPFFTNAAQSSQEQAIILLRYLFDATCLFSCLFVAMFQHRLWVKWLLLAQRP